MGEILRDRERKRGREAMIALQRSSNSYRKQGSSGRVWEDLFQQTASSLTEGQEDAKAQFKDGVLPRINTTNRSRSTSGGQPFRTGRVSPAIEPPSPKVSACGFCSGFGKSSKSGRTKPSKRR